MPVPVCRWCSKPLAKYASPLDALLFRRPDSNNLVPPSPGTVVAFVKTKGEVQQRTNLTVLSVCRDGAGYVYRANLWDGESYGLNGEGLFCSKTCGYAFGRAIAKKISGRN